MAIQSPQELFFYDLCAMYDVEQKLTQILPQLAQQSSVPEISNAFTEHLRETEQHVRNLEQCFQIVGRAPLKVESHTVDGMKQDHEAFLQQQPSPQALTMCNLAAGSQSEYLEIAAYHSLINSANALGLQGCVPLFQQNLRQEESAAQKLASFANQLSQGQPQSQSQRQGV